MAKELRDTLSATDTELVGLRVTLTDLRSEHEDAQVQAAASLEAALILERQAGLTALALANEAAEAHRQKAASTEKALGDQSEELSRQLTDAHAKDQDLSAKLAALAATAAANEEFLNGRIRTAVDGQGEAQNKMRSLSERTAKEMADVRRKYDLEAKKQKEALSDAEDAKAVAQAALSGQATVCHGLKEQVASAAKDLESELKQSRINLSNANSATSDLQAQISQMESRMQALQQLATAAQQQAEAALSDKLAALGQAAASRAASEQAAHQAALATAAALAANIRSAEVDAAAAAVQVQASRKVADALGLRDAAVSEIVEANTAREDAEAGLAAQQAEVASKQVVYAAEHAKLVAAAAEAARLATHLRAATPAADANLDDPAAATVTALAQPPGMSLGMVGLQSPLRPHPHPPAAGDPEINTTDLASTFAGLELPHTPADSDSGHPAGRAEGAGGSQIASAWNSPPAAGGGLHPEAASGVSRLTAAGNVLFPSVTAGRGMGMQTAGTDGALLQTVGGGLALDLQASRGPLNATQALAVGTERLGLQSTAAAGVHLAQGPTTMVAAVSAQSAGAYLTDSPAGQAAAASFQSGSMLASLPLGAQLFPAEISSHLLDSVESVMPGAAAAFFQPFSTLLNDVAGATVAAAVDTSALSQSLSVNASVMGIQHSVRSIPDPPRFPKEAGVTVPLRGFSQITAALVAVPKPDHTSQQQHQQRPSAIQPLDVSSDGDTRSLNTGSQAVAPRAVLPQQRAGAAKKSQRASTVPAAVSGDAPKVNRKSTKIGSMAAPEAPLPRQQRPAPVTASQRSKAAKPDKPAEGGGGGLSLFRGMSEARSLPASNITFDGAGGGESVLATAEVSSYVQPASGRKRAVEAGSGMAGPSQAKKARADSMVTQGNATSSRRRSTSNKTAAAAVKPRNGKLMNMDPPPLPTSDQYNDIN
ncbi:MAG: hypothetical protein WDW36_005019 [Sanguina aurantia]